mmetsp:Transcript_103344/g.236797  ORF Transcript_103344/g.236797 Transcript_103344/m.236797 type:complete len:247 (+) Transcript_103344:3534-4274(+)
MVPATRASQSLLAIIASSGKCLWKAFTAPRIPSSACSFMDIALAAVMISGFRKSLIPATNLSLSSFTAGMGAGPTPARFTAQPQRGWSPKNGTTKVGLPAISPADIVPAPPWCTTAPTCSKSQSCGQGPSINTRSLISSSSTSNLDQLLCNRIHSPVSRTHSSRTLPNAFGSGSTQLPKPTKIAPCPSVLLLALAKKSVRSCGGSQSTEPLPGRTTFPITSALSCQSWGLESKCGLHMNANGTSGL